MRREEKPGCDLWRVEARAAVPVPEHHLGEAKPSQAKPRPLFPAAVRQIAIVQAERCEYIIFKERLE